MRGKGEEFSAEPGMLAEERAIGPFIGISADAIFTLKEKPNTKPSAIKARAIVSTRMQRFM